MERGSGGGGHKQRIFGNPGIQKCLPGFLRVGGRSILYIARFLGPSTIPGTYCNTFPKSVGCNDLNVIKASSEKQVFSEMALGSSNISRAICKKKVNTTTVFYHLLSIEQSTTSNQSDVMISSKVQDQMIFPSFTLCLINRINLVIEQDDHLCWQRLSIAPFLTMQLYKGLVILLGYDGSHLSGK